MNEKIEKLVGWILLLAGVAIIGWSLYSSYGIFTGKSAVPEIFKIEKKEAATSVPKTKTPANLTDLQEQMEKAMGEQLKELIPQEVFSQLMNLISWSFLAAILIFGGVQLSNLGIKMIKKS